MEKLPPSNSIVAAEEPGALPPKDADAVCEPAPERSPPATVVAGKVAGLVDQLVPSYFSVLEVRGIPGPTPEKISAAVCVPELKPALLASLKLPPLVQTEPLYSSVTAVN